MKLTLLLSIAIGANIAVAQDNVIRVIAFGAHPDDADI
jgi:hypothetical protein